MSRSEELAKKVGREFMKRFDAFRRIEMQQIKYEPFAYSPEAFALLRDAELCYAAQAYFAAIVMAHSIIEIHLRKVEGLKGTAAELFRKAGIDDEVEWLRKLRNDITHGNAHPEIAYVVDADLKVKWERHCVRAFTLMHELPIRLYRANSDS